MAEVLHKNDCSKAQGSSSLNGIVYQIVLESAESDTDDDSNESICSLQAETTVSARDSSDISTENISEYELASSPRVWQHEWNLSSSENSPQQIHMIEIEEEATGSEVCEMSSDNNGNDSDEYVTLHRFPRCVMCNSMNENDFFQFCNSCYKNKKESFPNKPKGRKRKCPAGDESISKKKMKFAEYSKSKRDSSPDSQHKTSSEECRINADSQLSEEILTPTTANESSEIVSSYTVDSGIETNNSQEWNIDSQKEDEKCLACLEKSAKALFLHGKTGHRCCCYSCAKRIWYEMRRCPICRCKVSNIIKILDP